MKDKILSLSTKIQKDLIKIRRTLHQMPELAFEEYKTSKIVSRFLKRLGIEIKEGVAYTGVVGVLHGKGHGKVVALRADMDALPIQEETNLAFASKKNGIMHACGHDAHMAMLIGAAIILKQLSNDFPGTVKFIFQPSEERNPGGAKIMEEEGVLKDPDVDAIFGQHVTNDLPVGKFGFKSGPLMASADEIYITVSGKGGHGAKPHNTVDPVVIASEIVMALQTTISRMKNPFEPSVLTIGAVHGGTVPNVIPDEVRLSGTFRAMNETWRKRALNLIQKMCTNIAAGSGAKCTCEISRGYPVLQNSEPETSLASECAKELFGYKSATTIEPVMAAEDFSFFLKKVPGSFWWIGTGDKKDGSIEPLHSSKFRLSEQVLQYGSALLAYIAYRYLTGGQSIEKRRENSGKK
ncbi:MAG: M20 metallopeptidase family protein [Candidatus Kryptoniota bacterium]